MSIHEQIKEHMEVVGSDGGRVGTIDRVERHRLRLKKDGSYAHVEGHHRFIAFDHVAEIDGDTVRLSVRADRAETVEEDQQGHPIRR